MKGSKNNRNYKEIKGLIELKYKGVSDIALKCREKHYNTSSKVSKESFGYKIQPNLTLFLEYAIMSQIIKRGICVCQLEQN